MADINAEDLTEETAQTLDGSEQFVMFDTVEGKRGNIDVVGDYIAQHADADGQGHTAAQLAASAASTGTAAAAAVDAKVGTLASLTTTDKTNLVAAVNEVDAEVATKANESELSNYAKVDGAYESLTAGNAEQLISASRVTDKTPYIFRRAGGGLGIGDRRYTTLVGADVAVNQLFDGSGGYFHNYTNFTVSSEDANKLVLTKTDVGSTAAFNAKRFSDITVGHKYLYIIKCTTSTGIYLTANTNARTIFARNETLNGMYYALCDVQSGDTYITLNMYVGANADCTITFYKVTEVIDLTQYYGSASIADTAFSKEQATAGSGIAWLKANGFDFSKYRAYNAGSLESVNPSAIVTRGFNQLNASEFQKGRIDNGVPGYASGTTSMTVTGGSVTFTTDTGYRGIYSGKIKALPNTDYVMSYVYPGDVGFYVDAYRADDSWIDRLTTTPTTSARKQEKFTTPTDCAYFRISYQKETAGTTTLGDICVNVSKPTGTSKNGDYVGYSEHEYALGNVPLHGVFKEENGNIVAYGDTRTSDGTDTHNFGQVDMSTLTWTFDTIDGRRRFYAQVTSTNDYVFEEWPTYAKEVICPIYVNDQAPLGANDKDKVITGFIINNNLYVYLRDSSKDNMTADEFKASVTGKMLTYPLATPTTDTADPFTNPQVVDADGTEEFTVSNDVPVGNVTEYPENLREKLENLPEIPSAPSADGTYTLKATVSGGTVTYTWA